MGLWQKISDMFIKRDVELDTEDDEDDEAFISTFPYPKPDAHGEHRAGDEPAEGEGAPSRLEVS